MKAVLQHLLDSTWRSTVTRDRRGAPPPQSLRLLKAHRVERGALWERYTQARERLCVSEADAPPWRLGALPVTLNGLPAEVAQSLDARANELLLWHGSTPSGAEGISETGFQLLRSKNGAMFTPSGLRAAYFAECSSKSDEYVEDSKGIYAGMFAMLLCRVACGRMFHVTQPDNTKIEQALRSGRFDSVLGDREASAGTYREFVVFSEDVIYPEFVLIYERGFASAT